MVAFTTRLADGWQRALNWLSLALVPILLALFETDKILAILRFDGGHVGFKFGLPLSAVTVWQFVSVPNTGVDVNTGLPLDFLPLAFVTVPAVLLVRAVLLAGYFGSIRDALDGDSVDFVENCREYLLPYLVVTVVPFLLFLPVVLGVSGAGLGGFGGLGILLVVVAVVTFLIGSYLFYATPYLIVLREVGVVEAARQSYALAIRGGPYAQYAVGFVLLVIVVSPVATGLVVNLPVIGIPVGILGGGVLGLAANVTTMRFVADIDPESSVAVSWDDESTNRDTTPE